MSAHQPWQGEDAPEECIVCEKPWPCADALDEARAELGRIREQGNVLILDAENERDAARADAEALAEALSDMVAHDDEQRDTCGDWGTDSCPHNEAARKALAAHEAQKEEAG